jgi:DNA invertase Pin-like site-specific DNA recombinase
VSKEVRTAIAYLRTSSMTNAGETKDSAKRQREAIEAYARTAGYAIVDDDGVKGSDHVHERPGFAAMLARIVGNGVRVILVETASRFARDILVQETGHRYLKEIGVEPIAVDSPTAFLDDTPTSKMIRQLLGVISEFEKAATVARLAGARRHKRIATGGAEEPRRGAPRCRGPGQGPAPQEAQGRSDVVARHLGRAGGPGPPQ